MLDLNGVIRGSFKFLKELRISTSIKYFVPKIEITFFLSISRSRDTIYEFLVLCPQLHQQLYGKTRKIGEDEYELMCYFYILYILLFSSTSELEPKFQILVLFNVCGPYYYLIKPFQKYAEEEATLFGVLIPHVLG